MNIFEKLRIPQDKTCVVYVNIFANLKRSINSLCKERFNVFIIFHLEFVYLHNLVYMFDAFNVILNTAFILKDSFHLNMLSLNHLK